MDDQSESVRKIPIGIEQLLVGLRIPFAVYIREGEGYERLFPKWTNFDLAARQSLLASGIRTVYVEGDSSMIAAYLGQAQVPDEPRPLAADAKKMADYAKKKKAYHQIEKTLLVDKHLFVPKTQISFSLFEVDGMMFREVLEASSAAPAMIPANGVHVKGDLAVRVEDIPRYQAYLDGLYQEPLLPPEIKRKTRAIGLKENSKILMREVLAEPTTQGNVDQLVRFVGTMTDSLLNQDVDVRDLMSLRNHDLYTYTHSVNVSVLSVALGAALGLERDQLEKLGIGAMMHDIGKSAIPPEVLDKQGQLTDNEFRMMMQHPIEGVKMLEGNSDIPKESLVVILQHHEKLSGQGYPLRLGRDKITMFGRIAALVDSYDALTTPRPYRYAHTPYMALALLTKEVSERGDFDADCLKAFIKVVAAFDG